MSRRAPYGTGRAPGLPSACEVGERVEAPNSPRLAREAAEAATVVAGVRAGAAATARVEGTAAGIAGVRAARAARSRGGEQRMRLRGMFGTKEAARRPFGTALNDLKERAGRQG